MTTISVDSFKRGGRAYLELIDAPVMQSCVDMIRSCLVPAKGRHFVAGDYANIEGRVLAWLANETWKLRAFRDYDAGLGPDLYKVAAAGIYAVDISAIDGKKRQVGKVSELALGYEGGVAAFVSMAKVYGLRLDSLAALLPGLSESAPHNRALADQFYPVFGLRLGMPKDAWLACEIIKRSWRDKHPNTQAFWAGIVEAASLAARHPGQTVGFSVLRFKKVGAFLFCRLPSGRSLAYPKPHFRKVKAPWKDKNGNDVWQEQLFFEAEDNVTKKWCPKSYYGGLGTENAVQAIARDILTFAMVGLDADPRFDLVLSVHDELVAEADGPPTEESAEVFRKVMVKQPGWSEGLPIAVEAWAGMRYRK